MIKQLLFLSLVLCISGCSIYRVDSQDTTLDFYPPKSSANEVLYLEKAEKPHEVIGIVSVTTEKVQPLESVVEKMRMEAALLGGDAITDVKPAGRPSTYLGRLELLKNASINARYTAKVIKFK